MIIRLLLLSIVALAGSGCVALIAAKQRAALPPGHVGEAKIVVNIPMAGGGSLHVVDAEKTSDGTLSFAEYHSEIQTSYGMVKVDIIDGQIDGRKKK